MYYIGIDVAKQLHTAAIVDSEGNKLGNVLEFENSAEGFESLTKHFNAQNVSSDECIVAMESTGHYWAALYGFLANQNYPVAVINPLRTDSFRNVSSIRKTKTDRIDATLIAEFARFEKLNPTNFPSEFTTSLKELTRHHANMVKSRTAIKNEATAECDKLFPELAQVIGDVSCKAARAVMREFATPKVVANTDIRTLTKTIKSASQGYFGRKHAQALKDAAKKSVGATHTSDAYEQVLQSLVRYLDFYDEEIKNIEEKIANLIKDTPVEYLTTIPGIAEMSASTIAAEIGCPENFENASKLVAFAGLDPTKKQSGEFESTKNHISKRGSTHLRRALITSANIARMHDPYFGDYYDSLRARGKHHLVAITAVARKLAGVVLAIMKEHRAYEHRPSIQSQQLDKKAVN